MTIKEETKGYRSKLFFYGKLELVANRFRKTFQADLSLYFQVKVIALQLFKKTDDLEYNVQ